MKTSIQVPKNLELLLGREHDLDTLSRALATYVSEVRPPEVGAYQISCSDETEKEQVATFHRVVARNLLPELKSWSRSAFRTTNLGARYELGAAAIAEDHYAPPTTRDQYLLIKINAHVAVMDEKDGATYGLTDRYNQPSTCCGALGAMLGGVDLPFAQELRETFLRGANDRLAPLLDEELITPKVRALIAAACSSRLQADRLVDDLFAHPPKTPTVYLIANAVTLNRPGPDTELFCGCTIVDTREDPWGVARAGIGDDPRNIQVVHESRRVTLREA